MRRFVEFIIIMIALGAGMYSQRGAILDWVEELRRAALPEAETFEEVQEEETKEEIVAKESESSVILSEAKDLEDSKDSSLSEEPTPQNDTEEEKAIEPDPEPFPASINLAVPFTPQAPHADWAMPYKEACEEASIYMVNAYYAGVPEGRIDADEADADLLKIVAFEESLFGYFEDTTAEQTGALAELHFGSSAAEVIEDPTVDDIKLHLAAGRPVIVPAAGRLLGNPFFQEPGPMYHMLVIRGYTQTNKFIVNDPGTKRGEAFTYDFDTIMNAMHDWNQGNEITEGAKKILILYP